MAKATDCKSVIPRFKSGRRLQDFLLRGATTPLDRLEARALLRRALDGAPPGWPHVRAATELLRDATTGAR